MFDSIDSPIILLIAGCFQEKQYAGVKINTLHPIEKKPGDEKPIILNKDAWIVH